MMKRYALWLNPWTETREILFMGGKEECISEMNLRYKRRREAFGGYPLLPMLRVIRLWNTEGKTDGQLYREHSGLQLDLGTSNWERHLVCPLSCEPCAREYGSDPEIARKIRASDKLSRESR